MGTTIAYDLPVLDLIDELDATGHVSHTQHRKSKVTLHHNGGRLSHGGVLSVWQVRPASAHFNIDAAGTCAQFVRVAEYAWATGSTPGNEQSISIEMCNETVGPDWRVGELTWQAAARLAGWLFARVIGQRPTSDTLVVHHYWSATSCAGPFIDGKYADVLAAAQRSYDRFVNGGDDDMQLTDRMTNKWGTKPTVEDVWATIDYRTYFIETKIDAMAQILAQLAERDDNIQLSPEQLNLLRTDFRQLGEDLKVQVDEKLDETLANLELDADLGDDDVAKIKDAMKATLYTQMFVMAPRPNTGT
jgi:hypothetical protein